MKFHEDELEKIVERMDNNSDYQISVRRPPKSRSRKSGGKKEHWLSTWSLYHQRRLSSYQIKVGPKFLGRKFYVGENELRWLRHLYRTRFSN